MELAGELGEESVMVIIEVRDVLSEEAVAEYAARGFTVVREGWRERVANFVGLPVAAVDNDPVGAAAFLDVPVEQL